MDVMTSVLRVIGDVAPVPGLKATSTLIIELLNTVEKTKDRDDRMYELASTAALRLIDLEQHMKGKWDHASDELKQCLDEFSAVLQQILSVYKKNMKKPRLIAIFFSDDREIVKLERRLNNIYQRVGIILGINTLTTVTSLKAELRSQFQDLSAVLSESATGRHSADFSSQTKNLPYIDRWDLRLMRTLRTQRYYNREEDSFITLSLSEARHVKDGQILLVKTYVSDSLLLKKKLYMKDLHMFRKVWNASMLQIVGGHHNTTGATLQAYHAPGEGCVYFLDWLKCSMSTNPAEALFGLFDLRQSMLDLSEFLSKSSITIGLGSFLTDIAPDCIVVKSSSISDGDFKLIYAGSGLSNASSFSFNTTSRFFIGYHHGEPGLSIDEDTSLQMLSGFLSNHCNWSQHYGTLEDILQLPSRKIEYPKLTTAILERGVLNLTRSYASLLSCKVSCYENIALGDVILFGNSVGDPSDFLTLTNIHDILMEEAFNNSIDSAISYGDLTLSYGITYASNTLLMDPPKIVHEMRHRWLLYKRVLNILQIPRIWTRCCRKILRRQSNTISPHKLYLVIEICRCLEIHEPFPQDHKIFDGAFRLTLRKDGAPMIGRRLPYCFEAGHFRQKDMHRGCKPAHITLQGLQGDRMPSRIKDNYLRTTWCDLSLLSLPPWLLAATA